MKRLLSTAALIPLMFSAVVPNAWASDFDDPILGTYVKTWIQRNPNATSLWFEKGPFGKTLTTFTKQLSSYAVGKDPAELRNFYRGLEGKLGTMSKKLAAKCGNDTGKMAADFARLFDAKKSGACSNTVLVWLLNKIVVRQQSELDETSKIVENFEEKLGYLTVFFPTGVKATLKEVSDRQAFGFKCGEWEKDQCFQMFPFRLDTFVKEGAHRNVTESLGKTYDCQISKPFWWSAKLGFGEKIGDKETLTYDPYIKNHEEKTDADLPKSVVVRTDVNRQPMDTSGNLNREQALSRWNAVSFGKKVYSSEYYVAMDSDIRGAFREEEEAVKKQLSSSRMKFSDEKWGDYTDGWMVFELVRFNDFSSMTGLGEDEAMNDKINLWILHCRISIPYVGEI